MDESTVTGNVTAGSSVLFYCERCGSRVPTADFESGKARKTDETHAICGTCSPPAPKTVPSSTPPGTRRESQRMAAMPAKSSGTSLPAPRPAQAGTQVRHRSGAIERKPVGAFALIGIGAGVLVCIGVVLLSGGGEKPKATAAKGPAALPADTVRAGVPVGSNSDSGSAKEVVRPPVGPVEPGGKDADGGYDPRSVVAQSMLEGARTYLRDRPEDVLGYREKLQDLVDRYARTPAADEAARLLAAAPEPKADPNLPPEDAWSKAQDLLAAVDPQRDAPNGQWSRRDNLLVCAKAGHQKIGLPCTVPAEYDLRIVFTRTESNEAMSVNLVRGQHPITFVLAGWGNKFSGFEMVNGKRASDSAESVRSTSSITNGRRYTLILQVRANVFRAYVDGRFYAACRAPDSQISTAGDQTFRNPGQLGLGVCSSVYEFSEVKLLSVQDSGVAAVTPPANDSPLPPVIVAEPVPAAGGDDPAPPPAEGLQPGLYATFGNCAGDKLVKAILDRPEFDLSWDKGKEKVDPAVPADHFGILYRGFLRVPKAGRYTFSFSTNEIFKLWIDGKPVITINGNKRDVTKDVELTAGDHSIRIDYFELSGAHFMIIRWKPPGQKDFKDIPREALWHDASKADQNKKQ